jgi:hypothetical protein
MSLTFNEFKYWLDGFNNAITGGSPTIEQWKLIQEKINEVRVTETITIKEIPISCPITLPVVQPGIYPIPVTPWSQPPIIYCQSTQTTGGWGGSGMCTGGVANAVNN